MSKFIEEIIKDLKDNPETWRDVKGGCIEKDEILISCFGNTRVLSVISVFINGQDIPTSYIDRWRLEVAVNNWYKTIPLDVLKKSNINYIKI